MPDAKPFRYRCFFCEAEILRVPPEVLAAQETLVDCPKCGRTNRVSAPYPPAKLEHVRGGRDG